MIFDLDLKDPSERLTCSYITAIAGLVGAGANAGLSFYGNQQAAKIAGKTPRLTPVPIPDYASAGQHLLAGLYASNLNNQGPSFRDYVGSGGTAKLQLNNANPTPGEAVRLGLINPETGQPILRYDPNSGKGFNEAQAYEMERLNSRNKDFQPGGKYYSARMKTLQQAYDASRGSEANYKAELAAGHYGKAGKQLRRNEAAHNLYDTLHGDWGNPANMGYGNPSRDNPYLPSDPRYQIFRDMVKNGYPPQNLQMGQNYDFSQPYVQPRSNDRGGSPFGNILGGLMEGSANLFTPGGTAALRAILGSKKYDKFLNQLTMNKGRRHDYGLF